MTLKLATSPEKHQAHQWNPKFVDRFLHSDVVQPMLSDASSAAVAHFTSQVEAKQWSGPTSSMVDAVFIGKDRSVFATCIVVY